MDTANPDSPKLKGKTQDNTESAFFLYWFMGLFPILTSIVTPLTVYRKVLQKPNATDVQRYNDLLQEVSRQLVSGTIGLVSYFSGGGLTRGLVSLFPSKKEKPEPKTDDSSLSATIAKVWSDQHVKMVVGGSVLSFVGYSFVRPSLQTDILYILRKNESALSQHTDKQLSPWQKNLDNWINRTLHPQGQPQLKKAALLSFAALGTYLSALAFAIYGISRLFRQPSPPPPATQSTPMPVASAGQTPSLRVAPLGITVTPATYGKVYYQPTFASACKTPIF